MVKEDSLNTLIVNLYPNNEGYSLMLRDKTGKEVETVKLSYDESEFLDYLDAQALPPVLIDILEKSQIDLFYDGCIIVELRDYRRSTHKTLKECTYLLLKPTAQTIVRDVNALTSDSTQWTEDDKLKLEAELVLASKPRLCLDPSPEVVLNANRMQYNAKKLNNHALKRSVKRFAKSIKDKSVKIESNTSPQSFKLYDFIGKHRDKRAAQSYHNKLNRTTQNIDMWKQRTLQLSMPAKIDVLAFSKMHDQPKYGTDSTPEKIQEIVLEGEKTNNRAYYCKVTILRRQSTGEYLGELYLEEECGTKEEGKKEDGKKEGRSCRFSLGNRIAAQRYLQQFQELYTEEGRKSVKISTYVANQQQPQQQSASSTTPTTQTLSQVQSVSTTNQQATSVTSSTATKLSTNQSLPGAIFTQGNTYILTNAIGMPAHPVSTGIASAVNTSLQNVSTASASNAFTITASGNPYYVPASGAKTISAKFGNLRARTVDNQAANVQLTTAYIQPVVSGSPVTVTSQGITAVPIVGTNVNIVPGNIGTQFLTTGGIKPGTQNIRPAGPTAITMLQQNAGTAQQSVQVGQQRLQAQFAVPGSLLPISQMTRVGTNTSQQKGQQLQPGMASVMVHGKQVMVQGQTAMIQGQPTFIPSQTSILQGQTTVLPNGQTAIIQGGSFFLQGQPGQSLVTGQGQGQTVMIQQSQGAHQGTILSGQHQNPGQSAVVQGSQLQGQAVLIQGGGPGGQGQTFMLQNPGQQGSVSIITTSLSQNSTTQSIQIVQQQQQHGTKLNAALTGNQPSSTTSTALSALTSQSTKPAMRRRSSNQPPGTGGKRRPSSGNK
eukprot:gene7008-7793_t